jgi:hypothetical protein
MIDENLLAEPLDKWIRGLQSFAASVTIHASASQ